MLVINDNQLTNLDLSNNINLTGFIYNNQQIMFSNVKDLTTLYCNNNKLSLN